MTREEQIRQASIEYTCKNRPMCICGDAFSEMADRMNRNYAFEEGAKWADANPNLSEEEQVGMGGLGMMWQKQALIKKACEWLKKTMYIHTEHDTDVDWGTTKTINWVTSDYDTVDEFIDGFRKAMES